MKRLGWFCAVVLVLGGLAACGDDDDDTSGTATDGTATDAGGDAGDNVLRVTENEYFFEISGEVVAGNVTFAVDNAGEEPHEFAVGKLKDGVTLADVQEALELAFVEEGTDIGGGEGGASDVESTGLAGGEPATDGATDAATDTATDTGEEDGEGGDEGGEGGEDDPLADLLDEVAGVGAGVWPGGSYEVTASGIQAGDYAAICFLPTPDFSQVHAALGMISGFSVGEGNFTETPDADVTYTVTDAALEGPTELDAGETTIEIDYQSGPNEVLMIGFDPGKTATEVDAYFDELGDEGFPNADEGPFDFLMFAFDHTETRWFTFDLTAGDWALVTEDSDVEEDSDIPPEEDPHVKVITVT